MESTGKIAVAIIAAIGGFLAMNLWGPFSGGQFDYPSASLEEKHKYLEAKARNISRGFRLTAGGSGTISDTYVDAGSDLVSLSIKMNKSGVISASELSKARNFLMKTACTLTERELLTQTGFKLRIRYFQANGASLMTVEASGESCQPYLSQQAA